MLVISRKETESIRIEPIDGIDPSLTLREAFRHGPIIVTLVRVGGRRARLAVNAPALLKIWRGMGGDTAAVDDGVHAPGGRPRKSPP